MSELTERVVFRTVHNPSPGQLGHSLQQWLQQLGGPTHIHLHGRVRSRNRVVVTLLHGNEPSGAGAVFNLLKRGVVPAVDTHLFIVNTAAAIAPPGFHYRMLPGCRDLNRCFKPPFNDEQGQIAKALLDRIAALAPEAVIDIHNTSGEGPAFAVVTHQDVRHDALLSLFTHRVVITDLRLGALMEISERLCPTVTIECGGARSEAALHTAEVGLEKYLTRETVLAAPADGVPLDFYLNPIRLELKDKLHTPLTFAAQPAAQGITLLPGVERYNFKVISPEEPLGFVNAEQMASLVARDARGEDRLQQFFRSEHGRLYPRKPLKLFMITSNAEIARSDCLWYFVALE